MRLGGRSQVLASYGPYRSSVVLETFFLFSPFNHLTWVVDRENVIKPSFSLIPSVTKSFNSLLRDKYQAAGRGQQMNVSNSLLGY
jgi:hypothetical protein